MTELQRAQRRDEFAITQYELLGTMLRHAANAGDDLNTLVAFVSDGSLVPQTTFLSDTQGVVQQIGWLAGRGIRGGLPKEPFLTMIDKIEGYRAQREYELPVLLVAEQLLSIRFIRNDVLVSMSRGKVAVG